MFNPKYKKCATFKYEKFPAFKYEICSLFYEKCSAGNTKIQKACFF